MIQKGPIVFSFYDSRWEFSMENDTYNVRVQLQEETAFFIYSKQGILVTDEIVKKQVEESFLFQEIMEKIHNWEEKCKHNIQVSDVQLLESLVENEQHIHFFGFRIQSDVVKGILFLKDEEKMRTANSIGKNKKSDYFILPLVKNEGTFQLAEGYTMCRKTLPLHENPKELWLFPALKYAPATTDFFTHRTYVQDVMTEVLKSPSVKVKALFL